MFGTLLWLAFASQSSTKGDLRVPLVPWLDRDFGCEDLRSFLPYKSGDTVVAGVRMDLRSASELGNVTTIVNRTFVHGV